MSNRLDCKHTLPAALPQLCDRCKIVTIAIVAESMELGRWIDRQARLSAELMERAISATHLRRVRAPFGQEIEPARGSVLASIAVANWDPEPDYFFHWLRDSAIVMRTVAELAARAPDEAGRRRWTRHFEDYVAFSLRLARLDARNFPSAAGRTEAASRKFLRP